MDFYTGTNFDDAVKSPISDAVNPANSNDKNNDTTLRCNNSPTGVEATYTSPVDPSWYSQRNFCDLSSVWVDPDTGDWYGLVHNEFTPSPFGDGLHFDAIDYAVSKDQGKTWSIKDHAITSPYSTTRNDKTAFPNQTYYYGDGDQRLVVDTASGYFYAFYSSRVVDQGSGGSWGAFTSHVARAPISQKMAKGSWQKYYDGKWQTPGVGGKESSLVPVTAANPTGYLPTTKEYNPQNTGTWSQQIANGTIVDNPALFVMNVSYNAYLGKYIGTPETKSGQALHFYATDDLATQKWTDIGSTPNYTTDGSWYRWMVDSVNASSGNILGKTFRSYCYISCSTPAGASGPSGSEHVNVTIDSDAPAAPPVQPNVSYLIKSGSGQVLSQSGTNGTTVIATPTGSNLEGWKFQNNNDGSYTVVNASSGLALGVNSSSTSNRAWGTKPSLAALPTGGPTVGQQWFIQKTLDSSAASGASVQTGSYLLVNRYSGLVISLGGTAQTTPYRNWVNGTGSTAGTNDTAANQNVSFVPRDAGSNIVGLAGKTVDLSGAVASDSAAVINTVNAARTGSQSWIFNADGTIRLASNTSLCLESLGHTGANGTVVEVWSCNGGTNQQWTWDSGQLRNGASTPGRCLSVNQSNSADGTALVLSDCAASANQLWAKATTITGLAGKRVDVAGSVASGSSAVLNTASSAANQSWLFKQDKSVQLNGSNLCLEAVGHTGVNGTTVDVYNCNGGANQQWVLSGGQLKNVESNRCLDVYGNNTADNTRLIIWDCQSAANQQWTTP